MLALHTCAVSHMTGYEGVEKTVHTTSTGQGFQCDFCRKRLSPWFGSQSLFVMSQAPSWATHAGGDCSLRSLFFTARP